MMEFVQAHATYRFVISDEEDERPRLLVSYIWIHPIATVVNSAVPDMVVQAKYTTCLHHAEAVCLTQEWIRTCRESSFQGPRTIL